MVYRKLSLFLFYIFCTSVFSKQNYNNLFDYNYQHPNLFANLYSQQRTEPQFYNHQPEIPSLQQHLQTDIYQVPGTFQENTPLIPQGIDMRPYTSNIPGELMHLQQMQPNLNLQAINAQAKPAMNFPVISSQLQPDLNFQAVISPVQPDVNQMQLMHTNTFNQPSQNLDPILTMPSYSQERSIPYQQQSPGLISSLNYNPTAEIKTSSIQPQPQTQLSGNVPIENRIVQNNQRFQSPPITYEHRQNYLQYPYTNPYMSPNIPYPAQFHYGQPFPFQQYPQNPWSFPHQYPQMNNPYSSIYSQYMNMVGKSPYFSQYPPYLQHHRTPEMIYEEYDENNNLISSANGTSFNFTDLLEKQKLSRPRNLYNTYQYPVSATFSQQSASQPQEIKKFTNSVKNSTTTIITHTLLKPNKKPQIITHVYNDPNSGLENTTLSPENNVYNIVTNVDNVENLGSDSLKDINEVSVEANDRIETLETTQSESDTVTTASPTPETVTDKENNDEDEDETDTDTDSEESNEDSTETNNDDNIPAEDSETITTTTKRSISFWG